MKYLKQFGVIVFISFLGELLHFYIPLPIPASIYGIVILFLALELHLIRVESVKEVSTFLIQIMPVMFVPPAVGLLKSWDQIKISWFSYAIVTVITTIVVMAVSGLVTQGILRIKKSKEER